jgi:hypothetical protein
MAGRFAEHAQQHIALRGQAKPARGTFLAEQRMTIGRSNHGSIRLHSGPVSHK